MSLSSMHFRKLTGSIDTSEGLETCFSISYYARMRLIYNLLPLLRTSSHPQVLSVLNGGKEKLMYDDDVALQRHWSPIAVVNHTSTMTSLMFKHFAEIEKRITFIHASPGLVKTDIFAKLTPPPSSGITWRVALASIRGLVSIVMLFLAISVEESGERQAFHLTNNTFGPGAWLIGATSDKVSSPRVLEQYEQRGWTEKIWEHTMRIFEKASE